MQNREYLRQKGTMGVEKGHAARGGKISFSEVGGGGKNIIFGPKYRPLPALKDTASNNSMFVCNWTQDLQRIIDYLALA
jgi:hypothetical protein